MKYYWAISAGLLSALTPRPSFSDCAVTDCNTLGYTENSCPNGGIKCPFGDKWLCTLKEKPVACAPQYKYDGSNCPPASYVLCGSTCGDKYSECNEKRFKSAPFTFAGMTFFSTPNSCPYKDTFIYEHAVEIYYDEYQACYTGDQTCLNLFQDIYNGKKEITLTQNMNCGNLTFSGESGNYKIHGNGHTMTFDKPDRYDFSFPYGSLLEIDNLTIISKQSYGYEDFSDCGSSSDRRVFSVPVKLTNVNITSDSEVSSTSDVYEADIYGTCNIKNTRTYSNSTGNFNVYGTLNLSGHFGQESGIDSVKINSNATVNYKGPYLTVNIDDNTTNSKINACTDRNLSVNSCTYNNSSNIFKTNIRGTFCANGHNAEETPALCSSNTFSGSFWQ